MLIDLQRTIGGFLFDVFVTNFDWWVILGFVAQLMFTGRFLVQWIASEKEGRSVVPIAFWFFSIAGGLLLLAYAIYRRDPVFILGQAFGVFVYARNLYLIMKDKKRRGSESPKKARFRTARAAKARVRDRR
jgi:lipid-A-disaccharide synthase-like uncharacterized protein